jgi:hypothetical protein
MPLVRRFWIVPILLAAFLPAMAGRPPASPAGVDLRMPGHEPAVRWDKQGNLHMLFVREDANRQRLYYARAGSMSASAIAVSPASSAVETRGEWGPSLEILRDGTLVAVYSAALTGEKGTELRAQRSIDGGVTWSDPVLINDDGKPGLHGFASTAIDSSGELLVAWLDARSRQIGVTFSRSSDGKRFAPNRTVDPRTCQCCMTDTAAGPAGRFWIAYRGLAGKDVRDITLVRGETSGPEMAAPQTVSDDGWHINGCPESGPRMAVEADGTLWVAWFTGSPPGIFVAHSKDGGKSFSSRTQVAPLPGEAGLANYPDIGVLPDGRLLLVYESGAKVFGRMLQTDRQTWTAPVKLVENATHARLAIGGGRSALSFTGLAGNDTVAVASTGLLSNLTESPGSGPRRPAQTKKAQVSP